jgi:hypothetical protein
MADALGVFRDAAIELQKSNQREIREGRRRFAVAIESISEAFSLYDSEDRLVVSNDKYRTLLYSGAGAEIAPGMSFESIIRRAAERGYIKDAEGKVEDWVRERMAQHRHPSGPHVQQRGDGRWIMVSERKTDDGTTVAVYSDITELKQRKANWAVLKAGLWAALTGSSCLCLRFTSRFSLETESQIAGRRKVEVFFSDIAGAGFRPKRAGSEDLTQLLNHYRPNTGDPLTYGTASDKYVGRRWHLL